MKVVILLIAVSTIGCAQPTAQNEESTKALIERVRRMPSDTAAILALTRRTDDPQTIPTLRDAFAHAKISGAKLEAGTSSLPLSQVVAVHLLDLGVKDDVYFEEVAKYAREAFAASPPEMFLTATGAEHTGVDINPDFTVWCSKQNLDFAGCKALTDNYSGSLGFLLAAKDPRSIPIFREGLRNSNSAWVWMATIGLAQLNDVDSIPLIAQICNRVPPDKAESLAIVAADFDSASVEPLLERFIRDPAIRARVKSDRHARLTKKTSSEKE